jgi:RHS repeat-associated protein
MHLGWRTLRSSRRYLALTTLVASLAKALGQDIPAPSAREYDFSPPKGPHHRRVETTVTVPGPDGQPVEKPSRYIELATGMNYQDEDGTWHESEEKVEPHPLGAAAMKGYYKVIFGKNLNRSGAIHTILPDGHMQKNHPLGLYYYDRASGEWVRLSGMKDSEGSIVPPRQVLYRDAFENIRADVLYTYEKGRFEADVILRENPPAPSSFGLTDETTVLEMVTEFTETPEPTKTERILKREENASKRATMRTPDFSDEFLDFGSIQMTPGTAFALEPGHKRPDDSSQHLPVGKRWQKHGQRNILSEQVEYAALAPKLVSLSAAPIRSQILNSQNRAWPSVPAATEAVEAAMVSTTLGNEPGVVIDYVTLPGGSFSGTLSGTYYVADNFTWTGTSTFSSPYIKFAQGKTLTITGNASGSGAIFTAKDDNSVGEVIDGSTGSPSAPTSSPPGEYAATGLKIDQQYVGYSYTLTSFTFKFCHYAVEVYGTSGSSTVTFNSPIVQHCSLGFYKGSQAHVQLNNASFCGVATKYGGSVSSSNETVCSNTNPTISNITDSMIHRNTGVGSSFTIGDSQTLGALSLTASSSNTTLVPNSNLSFTGSGTSSRTIWVTPVANMSGQTTITVTVRDGLLTASDSFVVTVNSPPTITRVFHEYHIYASETSEPISYRIDDIDNDVESLTMIAVSNNQGLLPDSGLVFSGTGNIRTLKVTPVAESLGSATVSVSVSDGSFSSSPVQLPISVVANTKDPDGSPVVIALPGSPVNFEGGDFGGPGRGDGGGGGGENGPPGRFLGPCPTLDPKQFSLEFSAMSTCLTNAPFVYPEDPIPQTVELPTNDCTTCTYFVEVTLTGELGEGGSATVVGNESLRIEAPAGLDGNSCAMTNVTKTQVIRVSGGTKLGFRFSPGMYAKNSQASMTGSIIGAQFNGSMCAGDCPLIVQNTSVRVSSSLGRTDFGSETVSLNINEAKPSAALCTPSCLTVSSLDPNVKVVRSLTTAAIAQVKSPRGLANVVVESAYKYRVDYYPESAIGNGGNPGVDGFYTFSGAPSRSLSVANPAQSASVTNLLNVTEVHAGNTVASHLYVYTNVTATLGRWELSMASGMCYDRKESQTINGVRTDTVTIHPAGPGSPSRKLEERYQTFAWGESMVEKCTDPLGANERKVTYEYYTNVTDVGYGEVRQVNRPNGDWQLFGYDSQKRVIAMYSPLTNQAPTDTSSLCHKVEYDYTPMSGSGDTGAHRPQLPRREITYLLGQEVGRRYWVYRKGEKREIVCTVPGAAWNAAANLVTITKRHCGGPTDQELQSVTRPDGTMAIYTYAITSATKTTTVDEGKPNTAGTAIDEGTRTVTVVGLAGEMLSRTVYDWPSNIKTDEEIYSQHDGEKRPLRVTFMDGTYTEVTYGCCGVDSFRDRDGTVTTYGYDALKRKTSETKNNVTTLYEYDAANKLVAVRREPFGVPVQRVTLKTYTYDMGGRMVTETDGASVVTRYSESYDASTGQTTRTTEYADGLPEEATRVELFARDGTPLKVTGTAVNPVRYEYGVDTDGSYRKEIKLTAAGVDTTEWVKVYTDFSGRTYKTVFAKVAQPYPTATTTFNPKGQMASQVELDTVTRRFNYDLKGELVDSAIEMDGSSAIEEGGADRIDRIVTDVVFISAMNKNVRRVRRYVFPTVGSVTTLETEKVETSVDGLVTWRTVVGLVTKTTTAFPSAGVRTVTTEEADTSKTIQTFTNGRLTSVERRNSGNTLITQTTQTYDAHGRLATVVDLRTGTTTYTYGAMDRVATVTTTAPGNGQPAQVTTTAYDPLGRVKQMTPPDGTVVKNEYHLNGLLKKTYGTRTYPVDYTYDAQGRMKTMTTWKDFNEGTGQGTSGAAVTTWNYDPHRGWLVSKRDANNQGVDYTYKDSGRLLTRKWARSASAETTYGYNSAGDLISVAYTGGFDITSTYDRRGRKSTVIRNGITTTYGYDPAGPLLSESYTGGTLAGLNVQFTFDSNRRRQTVAARNGTSVLGQTTTYTYDTVSRLSMVSDGTYSANYSYLANSHLVSQIDFKHSATLRSRTVKGYDNLNRLQSIANHPGSSGAVSLNSLSYSYLYNDVNQRVRTTLADGSYWLYEYDALGQVRSGKRYWSDHTPVAGQQFEYGFDEIGNRTQTKAGGDAVGGGLRTSTYTSNSRNQYLDRTIPGAIDVLGLATSTATVTVNSGATSRKGEYFHREVAVGNTAAAVWQNVSVTAGAAPVSGNVFIPKTAEVFTHDADGNLLTDGRWNYTWDVDNRLIKVEAPTGTTMPVGARLKVEFEYDAQGRRIGKKEYPWATSAYSTTPTLVRKYLYDGWNLIAELDGNNAVVRTYMWGLDLSGSMQGAGGVGGLISSKPAGAAAHFACYDGNGNVVGLVDGSTGSLSANYEYGPFGETIRVSGTQGTANPVRFSSKYQDDQTGFLYYGYRYYDPSTGRWPNRDPIGEKGGANVYGFVFNQPTRLTDRFGLAADDHGDGWGGYPHPPLLGPGLPSKGNCFRFVCGDPAKPEEEHDGIPPGFSFELPRPSLTEMCLAMLEGMKSKGAKDVVKCECGPGFHRITVQFSPRLDDPHFSREFPDGTWWDKVGDTRPELRKGPKDIKPGYRKCGELCVPDGWDTDSIRPRIP